MARLRLTTAAVEKLKCSKDKRQEFFDALMPGLALRITKRGCKSWILLYRPRGKLTRLTLGRYPVLTLQEARNRARQALQAQLPQGYLQPATITAPSPAQIAPERLFKATFDEYIERYAKRHNKGWHEKVLLAKSRFFPVFGVHDLNTIKKTDILGLIEGIVDDGAPVQANLAFANIRKFFNWCVERSYIDRSPCDGLKPPTKVLSRERVLTDDEIKKIWQACDQLSLPYGNLFKVLLLTGQRRSEVSGMCWSEIENNIWTIPAARTKNGCQHIVALVPFTQSFIEKHQTANNLIFTTTGSTPISGFSKIKNQLDEASGVTDWRIHDLRRTCATGMARLKIAPHVIEKVLNHKSGAIRGIAAVYNRHTYLDECREALSHWSAHLKRLSE
jgi:integrase